MKRVRRTIRLAALVAAGVTVGAAAGAQPAVAGSSYDRIHADSFGNLIIHSPAGYKRIVVGQGHLARELTEYSRAGSPDVVYLDPAAGPAATGCRTQGVLVQGRSYMYGLDGVVPVLERPCR